MASKGQKLNKYTAELKEKILNEYFAGEGSVRSLGEKYNISYKTIDTWIYKFNHPELVKHEKKGRPKTNEEIDYKERYEILKKYNTFIEARRRRK